MEMAKIEDLISIRKYAPTDYNFIIATWLRGLYYGNSWQQNTDPIKGAPIDFFSSINKDEFMNNYHKIVDIILKRQSTEVKIASLSDDPDVIVGYSVNEIIKDKSCMHWIFVKDEWRRNGISKMLVPTDLEVITHFSRLGMSLKAKHVQFNPFII